MSPRGGAHTALQLYGPGLILCRQSIARQACKHEPKVKALQLQQSVECLSSILQQHVFSADPV